MTLIWREHTEPRVPVGSFRIVAPLGATPWSGRFLARHRASRRQAVVEVFRTEGYEESPVWPWVLADAAIIQRINSNALVELYGEGRVPGSHRPYVIYELVEARGPSILGLKDARVIVTVVKDVVVALLHAHQAGVLHRALSPDSIRVVATVGGWRGKLGNFASGRVINLLVGREPASLELREGTPVYIAPEVVDTGLLDVRTDVFSLAAVLYHALAGVPPFRVGQRGLPPLAGPAAGATPLADVAPSLPHRLSGVIDRALHPDPARRYSSMGEFGRAVVACEPLLMDRAVISAEKCGGAVSGMIAGARETTPERRSPWGDGLYLSHSVLRPGRTIEN